MKAKISIFLIALAIIFPAKTSEARVVKQEQSWLSKIFSNDSDDMVQKSPFSQPQKRAQNSRYQKPKPEQYMHDEEARTQGPKTPENTRRQGRHAARNNPQDGLYSERMQAIRQQRLNALNRQGISTQSSRTGVND